MNEEPQRMKPENMVVPLSSRMGTQLPLLKWVGWLTVLGFAIGLGVMYFVEDFIGLPAPLVWAGMVILLTTGTLLLNRPKLLLKAMLFYFMLLPGNRLLGILQLPLPTFLDELFFIPLLAVIVMQGIEGNWVKGGTWFPAVFGGVMLVSWYVNGRAYTFPAIRVALVLFKPFIIWYYCRLIRPMRTLESLRKFVWFYILFGLVQFPFNVLWTGSVLPPKGSRADYCTGLCGPGTMGSNIIGYISMCALFLAAGWLMGGRLTKWRTWGKLMMGAMLLVIAYDLVFMTGTKHALLLAGPAFLPFLLHPRVPMRLRAWILGGGLVLAGMILIVLNTTQSLNVHRIWQSFVTSPKGEMYRAVTKDFHHLVAYPLLGAGPGQFASDQAVRNRVPLARRYILPYMDEERRRGYYGLAGTTVAASVLGSTNADFLAVASETGWMGAACYYLFYGLIAWRYWRWGCRTRNRELAGYLTALTSCLLFCLMLTFLFHSFNIQMLSYPLWILAGSLWEVREDELEEKPEAGTPEGLLAV